MSGMARTMAAKVWDDHVVVSGEGSGPDLIYIDLHLVHEVTSPQAFDGLRLAGRPLRRPDLTLATERSEEHTSELQSRPHLVCRLLLEKKKNTHSLRETIVNANRNKEKSKTINKH